MLLTILIIGLPLVVGDKTPLFRQGQDKPLHTVTWIADEKLKTTVVATKSDVLEIKGNCQILTDLTWTYNVCGDSIVDILGQFTYYGLRWNLKQWSRQNTLEYTSVNIDLKNEIIHATRTSDFFYEYSLANSTFHSEWFDLESESGDLIPNGRLEAYQKFKIDNTTGDITIESQAMEANVTNSTGVWEVAGKLVFERDFRFRKDYFQINSSLSQVTMEKLKIDRWDPFLTASVGDYNLSIASLANMNVSHDPRTDTYKADLYNAIDHSWKGFIFKHVWDIIAKLAIDNNKIKVECLANGWRLVYNFYLKMLTLWTREEYMALENNRLTIENANGSLTVQHDKQLKRMTISCNPHYVEFGNAVSHAVLFNVYGDGLYIKSNLYDEVSFNRTSNIITFIDEIDKVVHKVRIDIEKQTMEQEPLYIIQNLMEHNTTAYVPYEIQTGIKKLWSNPVTDEQLNFILINDRFVELRVSEFRFRLNRVSGDVSTTFGKFRYNNNAQWTADGSFSATCDNLHASVKTSELDSPNVEWMEGNGKSVSMDMSLNAEFNVFYDGEYEFRYKDTMHLHSKDDFTSLIFGDAVVKIREQ